MRGEKGFALVITLMITALMVAVTVELIHQVYVDVSLSRGFRDGQQASLLAESGISGGWKFIKLSQSSQGYSTLADKWALPLKMDDETGNITVTITEESGRICLNDLVLANGKDVDSDMMEVLRRLSARLQLPDTIWPALADWLDSDDQQQSGGAESLYYQSLKNPYASRNGRLVTLAELSLVKGFTPEIIEKLKPYVRLYSELDGQKSRVNINTAPEDVIAALVAGSDAVRIVKERRLKPFKTISELPVELNLKYSVQGTVYRITSVAHVKETTRTVEAVVRLDDPKPLSWLEY